MSDEALLVLMEASERMEKAVEVLRADLMSIRTGRASPALVERLKVDYYDSPTPLNQLATISVPEPRLIVIRPWDPNVISNIEKAILKSDLGLTPINDGRLIRLNIPPLTEERRQELVKLVNRRVEEGRVAIRNIRRDTLDDLRKLEKDKLISEDEFYKAKDDLQELTDEYIEKIDTLGQQKQDEIMEI